MLVNQIRGNTRVTFLLNSFFVIVQAMHIFVSFAPIIYPPSGLIYYGEVYFILYKNFR